MHPCTSRTCSAVLYPQLITSQNIGGQDLSMSAPPCSQTWQALINLTAPRQCLFSAFEVILALKEKADCSVTVLQTVAMPSCTSLACAWQAFSRPLLPCRGGHACLPEGAAKPPSTARPTPRMQQGRQRERDIQPALHAQPPQERLVRRCARAQRHPPPAVHAQPLKRGLKLIAHA